MAGEGYMSEGDIPRRGPNRATRRKNQKLVKRKFSKLHTQTRQRNEVQTKKAGRGK